MALSYGDTELTMDVPASPRRLVGPVPPGRVGREDAQMFDLFPVGHEFASLGHL